MKRKYVVKNLFVHMNRVNTLDKMCKESVNCICFKGLDADRWSNDKDIFNEILSDAVAKARHWLNENSIYNTCYVSEPNGHIRLWNKVYLLKDDCKLNRRKIYIRPIDEEKYSTQYEDSQVAWSELWKEV